MKFFILFFFLFRIQQTSASPITTDTNISWYTATTYRNLTNSSINSKNSILQIPQFLTATELRPDFKITKNTFLLRARPRFIGNLTHTTHGNSSKTDTNGSKEWSEAYASTNINEPLALTYGLQNFQWGAAESASPSNIIFHEPIQLKNILYDTKGHHLFRINFSPLQNISNILLVELSNNGNPQFRAEEKFNKKIILKNEYAWAGGENYFALLLNWKNRRGFSVGEYFSLHLLEGLSFYTDILHEKSTEAWRPIYDIMEQRYLFKQSQNNRIYTYSVSGLRYAFENGNDLRIEWIFQEAGYSKTEIGNAWLAAPGNFSRASKIGLDFPGKNYLFVSYRVVNFLEIKNWSLYGRVLASMQDKSTTSYLSSENAIGEAGSIFASLSLNSGRENSELRGSITRSLTLGYKHDF